MMNAALFNELARNRRSTFPDQFVAGKKVDDDIIKEIITNACWAPNHGKQEPWHFTVFSGDGLQKLATYQSELYKELAGENFKEITYSKLQHNPLLMVLAAIGQRVESPIKKRQKIFLVWVKKIS